MRAGSSEFEMDSVRFDSGGISVGSTAGHQALKWVGFEFNLGLSPNC